MKTNRGKKIIILAASGLAVVLLALLYSGYQWICRERALYEQTDGSMLLAQVAAAREEAEEQLRLQGEQEQTAAEAHMAAAVEKRCEEYRQSLLLLVNPWQPVPEGYVVALDTVEDGYLIHRRCAQALMNMINDCRAAGNLPVICSAYRTQEYQEELYQNKIRRLLAEGVSQAEAPSVAARSVAIPGTSEHQLGLAVDLIDENYVYLTEYQQYTAVQQWLMAHCTDYGFILRYPNGSSEVTGIIFEPWHYRYVGVSTAKAVAESGLVFEEYLQTLET